MDKMAENSKLTLTPPTKRLIPVSSQILQSVKMAALVTLIGAPPPCHSTVPLSYLVEIKSIECAEAHGFAVLADGPRGGKVRYSAGVSVPVELSGRRYYKSEFHYEHNGNVLDIPVLSNTRPEDKYRILSIDGTYGMIKNGSLLVFYNNRWIYKFQFAPLSKSIAKRGYDSRNRQMRRTLKRIDFLENCDRHDEKSE